MIHLPLSRPMHYAPSSLLGLSSDEIGLGTADFYRQEESACAESARGSGGNRGSGGSRGSKESVRSSQSLRSSHTRTSLTLMASSSSSSSTNFALQRRVQRQLLFVNTSSEELKQGMLCCIVYINIVHNMFEYVLYL
jgi:hypothetical protein